MKDKTDDLLPAWETRLAETRARHDKRNPAWSLSPLTRGQPQRLLPPRHLTPMPRPDFVVDRSQEEATDISQALAVVGCVLIALVIGYVAFRVMGYVP